MRPDFSHLYAARDHCNNLLDAYHEKRNMLQEYDRFIKIEKTKLRNIKNEIDELQKKSRIIQEKLEDYEFKKSEIYLDINELNFEIPSSQYSLMRVRNDHTNNDTQMNIDSDININSSQKNENDFRDDRSSSSLLSKTSNNHVHVGNNSNQPLQEISMDCEKYRGNCAVKPIGDLGRHWGPFENTAFVSVHDTSHVSPSLTTTTTTTTTTRKRGRPKGSVKKKINNIATVTTSTATLNSRPNNNTLNDRQIEVNSCDQTQPLVSATTYRCLPIPTHPIEKAIQTTNKNKVKCKFF